MKKPRKPLDQGHLSTIRSMRNMGPKTEGYLSQSGVDTPEQLRELGPVEAFLRLTLLAPHLRNRMALYAIYGALTDQDCLRLPQETKDWLEDELKKAGYEY
jgi:DNA transformation protein